MKMIELIEDEDEKSIESGGFKITYLVWSKRYRIEFYDKMLINNLTKDNVLSLLSVLDTATYAWKLDQRQEEQEHNKKINESVI